MVTPDAVKEVLATISTGVNNVITDEHIKGALTGTIGQMFLMIDMIKGIHRETGPDKERIGQEIHNMNHRTSMMQGAIDTLTKQREGDQEGKGGGKGWNVLESKAVAIMKVLGADKTGFIMWHEKLVNIMEQL